MMSWPRKNMSVTRAGQSNAKRAPGFRTVSSTPAAIKQTTVSHNLRYEFHWTGAVKIMMNHTCQVPLAFLMTVLSVTAATANDTVDFVRDVRPIFQKHCYSCHADKKQKSGLRLDIKSEAFKGGEVFGESIIAGNATESRLIQFVADPDSDLPMPPEGGRLSAREIATLTGWVKEGANWPDGVDLARLEDRRDHWSFKPVQSPGVPDSEEDDWSRNEIDRFILSRLHQDKLQPATSADRVTWLRRVSFDLVGLPPSPEQVQAFVNDEGDDAFVRVVDELLKSERYGERWAQHWLDVVRYADTHGFEVNTERPNAWPYRDYVIEALNKDTPYDQFVREQIVGDKLQQDAATGFLVTASVLLPGQIGRDEESKRLARQDALDEIVVNIGQTFLGLSIGCARCHDHKFDPISQYEYYAMQAFVAGVEYGDREIHTPKAIARRKEAKRLEAQIAAIDEQLLQLVPAANSGVTRPPVNARRNTDRFTPVKTKRVRFTILTTNRLSPCIDELEVFNIDAENIALASVGTTVRSSGDAVVSDNHELRFVHDGRYGNIRSWLGNTEGKGWLELTFRQEETIDRVIWGRDRLGKYADRLATAYRIEVADDAGELQVVADSKDRAAYVPGKDKPGAFPLDGLNEEDTKTARRLLAERELLNAKAVIANRGHVAFAGTFRKPDDIHLLFRGDPEQPKEQVSAAVLSVIGSLELPADCAEQDRRVALADWLTDPDNPLTARVMVNRIWQGHFGFGLVKSTSDFGRMGTRPSHPKLLDWLAQEFIRSGWSIKHMHRLIVLSATYRQSSLYNEVADELDSDSRLLWRFPSRRLDAETIRDSMLAVSGRLDLKMGGPGFNLFDKRGGLSGFKPVESFKGDGLRRMIYAHKVRRERDAIFGAFDCPDNGQSTSRRRESATPIQALNLFNSRFTIEESEAFAARVQSEADDDVFQQIQKAYLLALSRKPDADELKDARPVVDEHGLATLCRVLLNSNEFLFLP